MNSGPANYFTRADFDIMEAAAMKALNSGKKINWKNPNSTAWGYMTPSAANNQNGNVCRKLTIYNNVKSVTNLSKNTFCKINGEWRITN